MLIVIAAGVSLIAAGLILFSDLQNSQRVKDATANVSSLYTNINELYKRDGTATLTEAELIAAGAIPNGMVILGGTDVRNVWGGDVTFGVTGASALAFDVLYTEVPNQETCVDFVEGQRDLGWDRVVVDGNASLMSALTTTALVGFCNAATDSITIEYYMD